jgi:hypothetical protein
MSEAKREKETTPAESESKRRSGTRRIDAGPISVPRPPRLPSVSWPERADQEQVPTQPENELPNPNGATLPAPPARPTLSVEMPDDEDQRDTIPSPSPHQD